MSETELELLVVCERLLAALDSVEGYDVYISRDAEPAMEAAKKVIDKHKPTTPLPAYKEV